MELFEFRHRKKISYAQIARDLGYCQVHIAHVARYETRAGKKLAKAIEEYTEGLVKAADLLTCPLVPKGKKQKEILKSLL